MTARRKTLQHVPICTRFQEAAEIESRIQQAMQGQTPASAKCIGIHTSESKRATRFELRNAVTGHRTLLTECKRAAAIETAAAILNAMAAAKETLKKETLEKRKQPEKRSPQADRQRATAALAHVA